MTPVPLELPLRPADAAAVGNLVFDLAERKALTEELRARLAARAAVLRLTGMVPYFGSLERDPVHPSTYYLAVDGEDRQPLLLHMAPANAPTSGLFRKPLLVGRMPRPGGPEMVINCLPFGPGDGEEIEKFASQTDPRLLPKPLGPRPALVVESARPEVDFPVALEAFRGIAKRGGKNLAALAGGAEGYPCAVWAAIRAGWREGYSAGTTIALAGGMEAAREAARRAAGCSRFTAAIGEMVRGREPGAAEFAPGLEAAAALQECIRQTRSARKAGRSFDFELGLEGSPRTTSAADLEFCLGWMKARGHAVQLASPELGGGENPAATLAELAGVALQYGCTLSVAARPGHDEGTLGAIGRATMGRVSYRLAAGALAEGAAGLATAIQRAAAHLFGG